jgi:hypothetical protein
MTRFDLPEEEFHEVTLEPEDRVTLGAREDTADAPISRIVLSRPLVKAIDVSVVDEDTRPFLRDHADREYYLVGLACSFKHDEREPVISAWVQVELRLTDDDPEGIVSAWSLQPEQLSDPAELTRTVEFDPSLKLTGVAGVGVEIGVGGKKATETHFTRDLTFLEGLGIGTPSPAWSFTRTDAHEIRGLFRLRFIAELSAENTAEGVISAGATIKRRLLGRSYVAALKDRPDLERVRFGATRSA